MSVPESSDARKHHFLRMMKQLRHYEEVVLYGNILSLSSGEQEEVTRFLEEEMIKSDAPRGSLINGTTAAIYFSPRITRITLMYD
ncbi:MAG TPA: hypothetical protein VK826_07050 [Bacteroidia bacterium]|nr:hypothetical protein [Bacteroidia bacterium]